MSGIGRSLEPSLGCEKVGAPVAVHVSRTHSMAGRVLAEIVLLELMALAVAALDDFVPDDDVHGFGRKSATPSPERSTIQADSMLPGLSISW